MFGVVGEFRDALVFALKRGAGWAYFLCTSLSVLFVVHAVIWCIDGAQAAWAGLVPALFFLAMSQGLLIALVRERFQDGPRASSFSVGALARDGACALLCVLGPHVPLMALILYGLSGLPRPQDISPSSLLLGLVVGLPLVALSLLGTMLSPYAVCRYSVGGNFKSAASPVSLWQDHQGNEKYSRRMFFASLLVYGAFNLLLMRQLNKIDGLILFLYLGPVFAGCWALVRQLGYVNFCRSRLSGLADMSAETTDVIEERFNAIESFQRASSLLVGTPGWWKTLAICTCIFVTATFGLPMLIKAPKPVLRILKLLAFVPLSGFLIQATKHVYLENSFPRFHIDLSTLLDGLKCSVVVMLYTMPAILGTVFIHLKKHAPSTLPSIPAQYQTLAAIIFLVGFPLYMYLIFLGALLWPLALTRLAVTGSLGQALNLRKIYSAFRIREKYTQNLAWTLMGIPLSVSLVIIAVCFYSRVLWMVYSGMFVFGLFLVWWKFLGAIVLGGNARLLFPDLSADS